jgi:hypothetical protein
MPGLIIQFHPDQQVPGVEFARRGPALAFHQFHDLFGGHQHFTEFFRVGRKGHAFFQGGLDLVLEP